MKKRYFLIALILSFCISMSIQASSETATSPAKGKSGGIKWYNYKEGKARGESENKKIFLHFYADWCKFCKVMNNTTFKDNAIIEYINENFIPIKVNADKNKSLAAAFSVRGLPVTWFIVDKGANRIGLNGYIPPDQLFPILKYIYTDSYKKMAFDEFKKKM